MNYQQDIGAAGPSVLSLAEGGPSARILERFIGRRVTERGGSVRLALILAFATWVPLAALSAMRGLALPGNVGQPFFEDITPNVRFLFALPLLVIADLFVGPFLARIDGQFVTSGLVTSEGLAKFDEIAEASVRFRDSKLAEVAVLAVAYVIAPVNIYRELGTGASSWLVTGVHAARTFTPAGWWYVLLSVPVYQFIIFRWFMRLCNWTVFLFRVSRLDLQIVPTHPDRAAGLGFIGEALTPISIIMLAASSVLCSSIAMQVIHRGARLQEFALAFGIFVVLSIVLFLLPFAVFVPKLAVTKRDGLITYGMLATRYVQAFDRKWVNGKREASEELLGSSDIQSLADLANSFDRIENMKSFPVELRDLRALLIAALLPAIPLVLTQFSVTDVARILTKVLF